MKKQILTISLIAVFFWGCYYQSNVPLETSSGNLYLTELLGSYYECNLDGNILSRDTVITVTKNENYDFFGTTYGRSGVNWNETSKTSPLRATNVGDLYFLEGRINDTYMALRYKFSGDYLIIYYINEKFVGKERTFKTTTDYRNFIAENSNNYQLFEKAAMYKRVSSSDIKNDNSDRAAAALLTLLGAIILGSDSSSSGSSGDCKCGACGGMGKIDRPFESGGASTCNNCGGSGRCN